MNSSEQVGMNVRLRRTVSRLSQEGLALLAGLDRTYVSELERGKHNVTLATLLKLAKALRCEPADLLKDVRGDE